jgi:hypothetical protein
MEGEKGMEKSCWQALMRLVQIDFSSSLIAAGTKHQSGSFSCHPSLKKYQLYKSFLFPQCATTPTFLCTCEYHVNRGIHFVHILESYHQ